MISRFFDFSSKPGLHPDQGVSPIIHAGQQICSGKRGGGVLAIRPRDASVVRAGFFDDCFWGRCPGCNPPSVLSSICLIGEPAPPAEDHRRLLPLSHRCRDPFHPQPDSPSKLPGRGQIIVIPNRARSRFCAPAQALTWHLLRPQRSPPCGWSFLKTTINGPVTAHRLAAYPNEIGKKCCADGLRTDIAPNVDPTWAQHLVRLGIAG